jgi:hypothetical protein
MSARQRSSPKRGGSGEKGSRLSPPGLFLSSLHTAEMSSDADRPQLQFGRSPSDPHCDHPTFAALEAMT